jgi:hypothetical protein
LIKHFLNKLLLATTLAKILLTLEERGERREERGERRELRRN